MNRLFSAVLIVVCFASADVIAQDSLDLKIGQMILIGFPGQAVDEQVLKEIRAGKVGSVIMFEKNIPPQNSFVELKKILWAYQRAATIPLFIAIDQEGGRVNRLKSKYGFPHSITAEKMGKDPTLDSVRFYGEATAATLAGLGINVNFAPVVDLASNPENPVIVKSGRAFSADPDSVTILAREFIQAHRKWGVITALKHFPGHGSSRDDTHFGVADVTGTWEEKELGPYVGLIKSGDADAVMSAHIVNRKLDPEGHPGTLSTPMLKGILRSQLGYEGVVFSDDMQMHAITEHYGLEDAVRMAILAGIDIMTFSNNISGSEERTVDRVHKIIRNFVETGVIPETRIDSSFRRIMKLKERLATPTDEKSDEAMIRLDSLQAEMNARISALEEQNTALQTQLDNLKSSSKKKRKKQ